MSKLQVATVALIVTRDAMTILPTTVPVHERPIVEAVFGKDNVQEADDQSAAVPVEIDVEGEVARLEGKFGSDALEKAHGKNYGAAITDGVSTAAVKKTAKAKAGTADDLT